MLQPNRTKYRKDQKGRNPGLATRGANVAFGDFGLKALERGRITARQIEAARRAITRHIKRGVMACPGGCAGGGGQPIHDGCELAGRRGEVLWRLDSQSSLRFSHENPDVQALYQDYLQAPLSHEAHHLLHTDHHSWEMPLKPTR